MPLPAHLDIDKIASVVWSCTTKALGGWLKGAPRDETAFINRLTEQLGATRKGCDVGLDKRVVVKSRVAVLHRQGPKATDLFGSDLAVTVMTEPGNFTKTAIFQVKKGNDFKALFERHQLQDALNHPQAASRSFVLYIDEGRTGVRLQPAKEVLGKFKNEAQTLTTSVADWMPLHSWLSEWLGCRIGVPSDLGSPDAIETVLADYEDTHPIATLDSAGEPLPSSAWLLFGMAPSLADLYRHPFGRMLDQP